LNPEDEGKTGPTSLAEGLEKEGKRRRSARMTKRGVDGGGNQPTKK